MSSEPIMAADTGHAFTSGFGRVTGYEADRCYGGTGLFRVLELPSTVEVDGRFPSLEAAQSHALALNEWLAARPDPAVLHPLFSRILDEAGWPDRAEPTFEELEGILERALRPERMGL